MTNRPETSLEHAEYLVRIFQPYIKGGRLVPVRPEAEKCALACANEVIAVLEKCDWPEKLDYWKSVKEQIEQL